MDDDGSCYMIYGAAYYLSIEKLTAGGDALCGCRDGFPWLLACAHVRARVCAGLCECVTHHHVCVKPCLADCLGSSGEVAAVIAANGTQYSVFPEYFVEAPTFVRAQMLHMF